MSSGTQTQPMSSTPHGSTTSPNMVEEFYVNDNDREPVLNVEEEELESEPIPDHSNATGNNSENPNNHVEPLKKKRKKHSSVWDDLEEVKDMKTKCKHCSTVLSISKSGSTTHLKRHMDRCFQKQLIQKNQSVLNFLPSNLNAGNPDSKFVSALHDGKFDMMVMREGVAHWIVMHEHSFSIVEEEGFNMMMKRGIPMWNGVSRFTIKTDAFKVYEAEKKKLKELLKSVEKISLTTDLWRSKPQKIEYMVLTGHFIDNNWKLQKRVLNFVHLPPPRKGRDIANSIFKCLKEWEIKNKVSCLIVVH